MDAGVHLTWPNKELTLYARGATGYAWLQPTDPCAATPPMLDAIDSTSPEANGNMLVVGDGLDAVEALRGASLLTDGEVRLVYIDPPFNTQKTFGQYGDRLARPAWLSMLRDRLEALKPSLRPDASIWVHLDDSEVHRARSIMDEVFGEAAFVASVIWQKRTTRESRSAFSNNHDTLLVYAPAGPRRWKVSRNLLVKEDGLLRNRDNDPRGPWNDAPFTAPGYRKAQQYDIVTPSGKTLRPPRGRSWYATQATFQQLVAEDRIWFPRGGEGNPRLKLFAHQIRGLVPFTVWGSSDVGTNDDAKRHLMQLFATDAVFDTPKPEELLERVIHISTNPGDLVVDLFCGSGTTPATAHKMRRRWVAVERNIDTVVNFALPRLTSVAQGADPGGITDNVAWTGGGTFDVACVAPRMGQAFTKAQRSTLDALVLASRPPRLESAPSQPRSA